MISFSKERPENEENVPVRLIFTKKNPYFYMFIREKIKDINMAISFQEFLWVFGLTLFAGLSTAIGGAIAFFHKPGKDSGTFLSASLGFSAGVMIYISLVELMSHASDGLRAECGEFLGGMYMMTAFALGLLVTFLIDRLVPEQENPHTIRTTREFDHAEHASNAERKRLGRAGFLFALAIGIHNFPEGLAAFAGGLSGLNIGIPIAVAIALHNIPEGIAIGVPILYATGSRKKAFYYSLLSGLAEPAGALVGFALLMPFLSPFVLASLFAFVSGVMIYISFDELLPMSEKYGKHHIALAGVLSGMIFMGVGLEISTLLAR